MSTRLRVGLVLGGGGLSGMAFHAGVLTALSTLWDARTAEVIVGTSAGSMSTALMRAGFPPADYVARVTGSSMSSEGRRVLSGLGPRRPAARRGRVVPLPASPGLLRTAVRRPWRLPPAVWASAAMPAGSVPSDPSITAFTTLLPTWPAEVTWVVAVRLSDGARVVFGRDEYPPMGDAIAASTAIPGYFRPVLIGGQRFVDGGAWSMHSLDLLAGAGLDLVIVSAPMSTADQFAPEAGNLLRVPVRRQLDREAAKVRAAGTRVVIFQPDAALRRVMGSNAMDVTRRAPVARAVARHVSARLAADPLLP